MLLAFTFEIIHEISARSCRSAHGAHKVLHTTQEGTTGVDRGRSTARRPRSFQRISRPELFFGMVGAIGTDLDAATTALEVALTRVGYRVVPIKLSSLPQKYIGAFRRVVVPARVEERYRVLMSLGTEVRRALRRKEALARLAISEIREKRVEARNGDERSALLPVEGVAYVLKQLKRPEEINFLRQVYGGAFQVVAVHAHRGKRRETLASRIARSHFVSDAKQFYSTAEELIEIDERERGHTYGQDVRDAFPLADFFVGSDDNATLSVSSDRIVRLLFGDQFATPTKEEMAMAFAQIAAYRSSDLNRQVGAAIVTPDGRIVSVGCNEVPAFGGGQYWGGERDARDFRLGYDSNTRLMRELVLELLGRLKEASGWLQSEKARMKPDKLVDLALDKETGIFAGARAASLIEFGRMLHAEMAALMDAVRSGSSIAQCDLYTTTFPCHMCMRLLVGAGIRNVYYIEPYAKSLAAELYSDSIIIDPDVDSDTHINVKPYAGVAPRRYQELFSQSNDRKYQDGAMKPWNERKAVPVLERFVAGYIDAESLILRELGREVSGTTFKAPPRRKGAV
jgi:deoxycytidylate deaminase